MLIILTITLSLDRVKEIPSIIHLFLDQYNYNEPIFVVAIAPTLLEK